MSKQVLNWAGIKTHNVPQFWHLVEPFIQDALDYHQMNRSSEYYKKALLEGSLSLWMVWEEKEGEQNVKCVLLSGIARIDGEWFCHIPIISGEDMDLWLHFLPILERWAMSQGARYMDIRCRKGFKKILAKEGYRSTEIILTKDLGGLQ